MCGQAAIAQANKEPINVRSVPTLFNKNFDPYRNYADQGRAMYINNSAFYNKDNIITNNFPVSNGRYMQPGNSNPVNHDMNERNVFPSGTIYSGFIPIRGYGNTENKDFNH